MTKEILTLIDNHNYAAAYNLVKQNERLAKIYVVWTLVYDGQKFETIDRTIHSDDVGNEIIESVKLYIHLSQSSWDKELLSEFRRVAKMIIAEIAAGLRNASHTIVDGQIIHTPFHLIKPDVRDYIQELIEHFDKKELYESKADMARVKAQLTLTMNLEKRYVGADMIQYGTFYENVKQYEDSVQIYYAVVHDFEEALDSVAYEDKEEQLLELGFLKDAYEGILRLTDTPDIQQKLDELNVVVSTLQHQSDSESLNQSTGDNHHVIEKKSWFKRILNN